MCYKSTKTKHHGFLKADQPPPKKRRVNSHGPFSLPRDPGDYFDPNTQTSGNPAGSGPGGHPEGGGSNPAQEEEKVANKSLSGWSKSQNEQKFATAGNRYQSELQKSNQGDNVTNKQH